MPDSQGLKKRIIELVLEQIDRDADRRAEAVAEYVELTAGFEPEKARQVAGMVPPIQSDLYARWVDMFADRLLETVPEEQIEHLADGTEENKAALVLVYLMFLESERMEKQVEKDLTEYGRKHSNDPDLGQAAASCIRSNMARTAEKAKKNSSK